jgi:hypothetical protein
MRHRRTKLDDALRVARVASESPYLSVRGAAGYEGALATDRRDESVTRSPRAQNPARRTFPAPPPLRRWQTGPTKRSAHLPRLEEIETLLDSSRDHVNR